MYKIVWSFDSPIGGINHSRYFDMVTSGCVKLSIYDRYNPDAGNIIIVPLSWVESYEDEKFGDWCK